VVDSIVLLVATMFFWEVNLDLGVDSSSNFNRWSLVGVKLQAQNSISGYLIAFHFTEVTWWICCLVGVFSNSELKYRKIKDL
jgi:hypothetical protein